MDREFRTDLRRYMVYHSRLPTLPSRKQQTSLWRPASQEFTPPGARSCIPLFFQTVYTYTSVPLVPFGSCLPQKIRWYKCFGFTKTLWFWLIWTWKHISKPTGVKGDEYHPERIFDNISSSVHCLSKRTWWCYLFLPIRLSFALPIDFCWATNPSLTRNCSFAVSDLFSTT